MRELHEKKRSLLRKELRAAVTNSANYNFLVCRWTASIRVEKQTVKVPTTTQLMKTKIISNESKDLVHVAPAQDLFALETLSCLEAYPEICKKRQLS